MVKKFDDMFSCIDTILSRDGWTNRQTDGAIFNSLNNPYARFHAMFDGEYLRNGTRYRRSYNQILIRVIRTYPPDISPSGIAGKRNLPTRPEP